MTNINLRVRNVLFFCIASVFVCCNSNKPDVDAFIKKYQDHPFSEFNDVVITFRSDDFSEAVYAISKPGSNLPVYFVTYNYRAKSISDINNSNLKAGGVDDYFTTQEIKNFLTSFLKYDFYILGVDREGDVLINPFMANNPVWFLRTKKFSGDKEIRKGFVFKHYKDNWYINTTHQ